MVNRHRALWSILAIALFSGSAAAQPQIAVNGSAPATAVSIPAGAVATVAIVNGPGNSTDWVGLFPAGYSSKITRLAPSGCCAVSTALAHRRTRRLFLYLQRSKWRRSSETRSMVF
jgi:hypothetical protein